ncbi:MAG: hypothetical protein ACUVRS_00055 [Armatimonadota bacterium]
MTRIFLVLLSTFLIFAGVVSAARAGVCFYGLSGLIETPDDTTVDPSAVKLMGWIAPNYDDSNVDVYGYGGAVGIIPKLEVGFVALDMDVAGSKARGLVSAKYRLVDESADRPSITVGVVDVANQIEKINLAINDISGFVVFGRSVSSMVQPWATAVTTPLKFTLGFGTGLYKGVFVGADWSPHEKLHVAVEYLSKGLRQKGTVNAGLRYNLFDHLVIDAGTAAFKGFYGGANYTLLRY